MAANGGSIPATPEMLAAQPNTRAWIRAWVSSFEGDIEDDADALTEKLVAKGFHSRRSLRGMRGCSAEELSRLLEVPYGVASEFKAEAEAMHGGLVATSAAGNMMGLLGGSAEVVAGGSPNTWKEFTVKLRGDGAQLKVPTKQELDTYGARLIPYVAAQDGDAAGVVREYLQDPGCEDLRFELLSRRCHVGTG